MSWMRNAVHRHSARIVVCIYIYNITYILCIVIYKMRITFNCGQLRGKVTSACLPFTFCWGTAEETAWELAREGRRKGYAMEPQAMDSWHQHAPTISNSCAHETATQCLSMWVSVYEYLTFEFVTISIHFWIWHHPIIYETMIAV